MKEYFPQVPQVVYEGPSSKNPYAFKFYNPDEVVGGKTMREQLKFAMSWWHTLCAEMNDPFGVGTRDRTYGGASPMEIARNKAEAGFEFMNKLGIDYFCFHDRDVAPEGATLAETNANLDEITNYIGELARRYNKKMLWGTANLFGNPRYMSGAGTSPNPDAFAYADAQIKKALEVTVKLGGAGYVFWGGREGYETLLNTDMGLELDNMARLMRMAVDYGRKIGFKGGFMIEPKPKEPTKHQYDFDAAACYAFLQKYGLDGDFTLNIEANHATLAQHTFQHELRYARINGIFGSVDANRGDLQLGWDTDQFPTDVYDTTLCMCEILAAGGFVHGGLNFDAKVRRASWKDEDLFLAYISGMDALALGLRNAVKLQEDGRIDAFVAERYAGWNEGIGAKIRAGETSLEELEQYALALPAVENPSGRQEMLESVLNQVLFG